MDLFAQQLLAWFDKHGRTDLPWQQDITPYRVWVSEIMLQQTQVSTVIDYYNRFMARFPDVTTLARAPLDEVLHAWTGLGYYARARNLHKAAQTVVAEHAGGFPVSQDALEALPGIGRSTAGAIRAIAHGQQATILDGNVKRVLTRFHAIDGYPGKSKINARLWQLAQTHTPQTNTGAYTQAIMDLGATLCTRRKPNCNLCPISEQCMAYAAGETERYPHPKPKKNKPVRNARFFVLSTPDNATLLEQKPLNGLWGGLWTPPQRDADTPVEKFLIELGIDAKALQSEHLAPTFRHTFTHYHLDIEPVYLRVSSIPVRVEDTDNQRWVKPDQLGEGNNAIGLSAPAVKLLASLGETLES